MTARHGLQRWTLTAFAIAATALVAACQTGQSSGTSTGTTATSQATQAAPAVKPPE